MPVQWRIRPALPVAKLIGAVAVVVLAAAFGRGDPIQWVLAGALALGLVLWAVRDFAVPVRVAAFPEGVMVVQGLWARRYLPWPEIERIRVDRRSRFGLANELLEIDAGDSLHLFTTHELGTHPEEVAEQLEAIRGGTPQPYLPADPTAFMRPAQPDS